MSVSSESRVLEHITVDGERLRIARTSGTGTPLLLCNDLAANLDILDEFVIALDRPVICFDLPGIGESADPRRMRRMSGVASLLVQLLDALGERRAIDVMGIGWGGLLAQQFARDYRTRVRRLVLAATSGGQLMFPGRLASLWQLVWPDGLAQSAPDAQHARTVFGGRRDDECQAISRALVRVQPPTRRGHLAQLYALAGFSSLHWLARLTVPTLVLAGDDDPIVPMVNARLLALLMPQARLSVICGGGHWFALERTSEVVRRLEVFLSAPSLEALSENDNKL